MSRGDIVVGGGRVYLFLKEIYSVCSCNKLLLKRPEEITLLKTSILFGCYYACGKEKNLHEENFNAFWAVHLFQKEVGDL